MDFFQVITLAILQGLTEFLPISSSAHLILVPKITLWPDQGIAFDVAVHLGTLIAVAWYFRTEIGHMWGDWTASIRGKGQTNDSRLAWGIIVASIPVAVIGLLFHDFISTHLRSPIVIMWTTAVFGVLLYVADRFTRGEKSEYQMSWLVIITIGLFQALALVPGTSRSGITMTAALLLGMSREGAARFSFLLAIPAILMAGGMETLKLMSSDELVQWGYLFTGAAVSGVTAYLCIKAFIAMVNWTGMTPYVVYRLMLAYLLWLLFA